MSAAMMAMPVAGIVMALGIVMMTVHAMTPTRTAAHGHPTFRGNQPILRFHAGSGFRYVGNDISAQTHCIRGAGLAHRVTALGDRTVRATR